MTYSGHPVACAAALKNIEVMEKEGIPERVRKTGKIFEERLKNLTTAKLVKEVRGSHFMIAIEFNIVNSLEHIVDVGKLVADKARNAGLIVRPIPNALVLSPPLILTEDQIDKVTQILSAAIASVSKELSTKKLHMPNEERTTGWVFSEHYLWHDTGTYNLLTMPSLTVQPGEHAENEATKRRFVNLMEVSSLSEFLVRIKPRVATEEELLLVHSHAHLKHLKDLCASGGGEAGSATPIGPASYHIARLAVGGVIAGVDSVLQGDVDNVYVLCRPPGHHAERELATGFCLLANGAIGVRYARKKYELKRIAVVDYDVHHGNGCETLL